LSFSRFFSCPVTPLALNSQPLSSQQTETAMPISRITADNMAETAQALNAVINARSEWLFVRDKNQRHTNLLRGEMEIKSEHGKLFLSYFSDTGVEIWRVTGWECDGERFFLEASRRMGAEKAKLEFIPRTSSETLAATVDEARRERCFTLAELICARWANARIERVGLSQGVRKGVAGRYARIILKLQTERVAVTSDVTEDETQDVDSFLASALLWFKERREKPRGKEANKLWLIANKEHAESLVRRAACLRSDIHRAISIYEIGDERQTLSLVQKRQLDDLWTKLPERIARPSSNVISDTARSIIALAPEAIDVVRSRHGETLRYHGLPFCRIRRAMKRERVWFGVEAEKRMELGPQTLSDFDKLFSELISKRRADAEDKRHDFYRLASEAWLESILRRDITRLDPGLIIAPLHAQFRAAPSNQTSGSRPVDLLALRRDGRLGVIELKTAEDRELIFQGIDYWRQVELHRRAGNIAKAKLFEDREILDQPPLVYLVAPTLSFHRSFSKLAQMISPEIEVYRFDLNEDWRVKVRVMRRMKLNAEVGMRNAE
jgi:hypothetical protein